MPITITIESQYVTSVNYYSGKLCYGSFENFCQFIYGNGRTISSWAAGTDAHIVFEFDYKLVNLVIENDQHVEALLSMLKAFCTIHIKQNPIEPKNQLAVQFTTGNVLAEKKTPFMLKLSEKLATEDCFEDKKTRAYAHKMVPERYAQGLSLNLDPGSFASDEEEFFATESSQYDARGELCSEYSPLLTERAGRDGLRGSERVHFEKRLGELDSCTCKISEEEVSNITMKDLERRYQKLVAEQNTTGSVVSGASTTAVSPHHLLETSQALQCEENQANNHEKNSCYPALSGICNSVASFFSAACDKLNPCSHKKDM